jgi:hypothetical protein
MKNKLSKKTATKIITMIDVGITLAFEQIGATYQIPAYHPFIIGGVAGATYLLLSYGEPISKHLFDASNMALDTIKRLD